MAIQSLTREQLLALLAAAREKRERDFVMILVAFCHGLRASEVVALKPNNFADGFLTLQRLKGSLKTTQALHEDTNPLLNERAAALEFALKTPRNQRLFPITRERFWQLVQEYGKAADLPRHLRHPHVLKHSIAMQTIGNAGIHNVRQHLGHKSISSTGAYLAVNDDSATDAIEKALRV